MLTILVMTTGYCSSCVRTSIFVLSSVNSARSTSGISNDSFRISETISSAKLIIHIIPQKCLLKNWFVKKSQQLCHLCEQTAIHIIMNCHSYSFSKQTIQVIFLIMNNLRNSFQFYPAVQMTFIIFYHRLYAND